MMSTRTQSARQQVMIQSPSITFESPSYIYKSTTPSKWSICGMQHKNYIYVTFTVY